MRRANYAIARLTIALLGATTVVHPRAAEAQQGPSAFGNFVSLFDEVESDPNVRRPVLPTGDPDQWLAPNDLPEAAFQSQSEQIRLRVTVGPTDKVVHCSIIRPSASVITNQRACSLIEHRGHFRHALSLAGKPVSGQIDLFMDFGTKRPLAPPAPPAPPPGGFPYTAGLTVVREPDWQSFATPGMLDSEIVISLSLYPPMRGEPEKRFCFAEGTPRDDPLEKITCAAAKSGEYAPIDSSNYHLSPSIKMLVRWRHGHASYQVPTQAQATPAALRNWQGSFSLAIPPGTSPQIGSAALTLPATGPARCQIAVSTGVDKVDSALCEALETVTFTPEIDIFGREVSSIRYFRYRP